MKTIIAFDSFKLAAAYFDRFIPFPWTKVSLVEMFEVRDYLLSHTRTEKDAESAWRGTGIPQELAPYFHVVMHFSNIEFLSITLKKDQKDCVQMHYDSLPSAARKTFDSLLGDPRHMINSEYKWPDIFGAATEYHSRPFLYQVEYFGSKASQNITNEDDPLIQIASLPILEPDDLKWDTIQALRNDKVSQVKLRRLRAFFFENYAGKPKSFIEDDLLTRIDDHQSAAKDWGLSTLQTTLSLGGTKGLMTSTSAGLVAVLAGQSVPIAAAIGASAVLGSTTVSILTSRKRFKLKQAKDPVAYIMDLKNNC